MPVNPADSPVFGALYGSDAMRAVFDETALFRRMLEVEAALARVQGRLGIIPQDAADAITAAARPDILRQDDLQASARNIGYPVSGVVKSLTRAAGEAGNWTHWGATTQDIVDTAQALQIREGLTLIRAELLAVIDATAAQADRHRHTVMAARSYMQQALPTTFGLRCATWLMPLIDHVTRLDQLRPRAERVEFGGAAGTLASLGDQGLAVMEALAAELGLAAPQAPWHVARDAFAEAVSFLGLLCGSLGKMANDIILLAQTEVGEVAEPHVPGRGGSSTLPHKRNPIASAYVLAAQRGVQSLVPLMQSAMLDQHERGAGPWQSELLALPQAFVLTHGALQHARLLAEGLVVDPARMRRNLDITGGAVVAEAVSMGLAPLLGREQAHERVKHASDRALKEATGLTEALLRDPTVTAHLDEPAIRRLTDPANYLGAANAFIDRVLRARAALTLA